MESKDGDKDHKNDDLKKEKKGHDGDSSDSIDSVVQDENLPLEEPAGMFSLYNAIRLLMKFSMAQFFKDITVLGLKNIPKRGPVIFCGNHCNQFVDGAILFTSAGRDVRFMVAAKVSKLNLDL